MNKLLKGNDHQCSLDPQELQTLVSNVRSLEKALGNSNKIKQLSEMACYEKLGKTLVYAKNLKKSHQLEFKDIAIKVTDPKIIDGSDYDKIIERILIKDVKKDESIYLTDLI